MDQTDRIWDIIEGSRVAMLTTKFAGGLRARPMEARPDREARQIYFVTDRRGQKDDEIEAEHDVGLVFTDDASKAYLSITGRAVAVRDPAKARDIWKKTDDVWWPGGPEDENARVLCVTPVIAELRDGPASRAAAEYEFAKARLTGQKPNLGENRKVTAKLQ